MIRVLVVDDSAIARQLFVKTLSSAPDIQVVAEAENPFVARDKIVELAPDVLLLDVEMPKMDGITFLRRLMHYHPMPVVICSSLTTDGAELSLAAFDAGAVEVISKPNEHYGLGQLTVDLIAAVRTAAVSRRRSPQLSHRPVQVSGSSDYSLIAIGASTGGTVAVEKLVRELPRTIPPLVIVQHMPQYITRPFAERLNKLGELKVEEAQDGAWLEPGTALVAPGGEHVMVERLAERLRIRVRQGPRVNGHRPSVDVLFASVAKVVGPQALGVLLTGMGKDGAEGMLAMHQRGAHTIAQDEASSVVFGMPKAAIDLGAVDQVSPLSEIAARIAHALSGRARARRSTSSPRP